MGATIFDGLAFANQKEKQLKQKIGKLKHAPRIASVVFQEDPSSQLYTRLKMEAAIRVGIEFDRIDVSLKDDFMTIKTAIHQASKRQDIDGIMIQKPTKKNWQDSRSVNQEIKVKDFQDWWRLLTSAIDPKKDVDCLTQKNLNLVYSGESSFVPATVKAVLSIISEASKFNSGVEWLKGKRVAVVGRSDIVGKPLAAILKQKGAKASLLGSKDDLKIQVAKASIVVSATGVAGLITADIIKQGAIIIDVGSPKGDVDFNRAKEKASFITPVPDGVGPVTVVSLLENLITLIPGTTG